MADTAEDAIVTTVNRGGDTDMFDVMAEAVTGTRFGENGLPDW